MPKYLITLKETTYQEVIVEAKDEEEAEEKGYEAQFECGFGWNGKMFSMVDSIEKIDDKKAEMYSFAYKSKGE